MPRGGEGRREEERRTSGGGGPEKKGNERSCERSAPRSVSTAITGGLGLLLFFPLPHPFLLLVHATHSTPCSETASRECTWPVAARHRDSSCWRSNHERAASASSGKNGCPARGEPHSAVCDYPREITPVEDKRDRPCSPRENTSTTVVRVAESARD